MESIVFSLCLSAVCIVFMIVTYKYNVKERELEHEEIMAGKQKRNIEED